MKNGVLSRVAQKRFAQALHGTGSAPTVKMIAIGDGGLNEDGDVRTALAEDISLHHELLRKNVSTVTPLSDSRYRYEIRVEKNELPDQKISELALIDEKGNLFYTECFNPKTHYKDTEKVFEIDIECC